MVKSNSKYYSGFAAALLALCALFIAQPAHGANLNKVIVKDFDWKICPTEHFDIYYCEEGKNILPDLADILEKSFKDVTENYGCQASSRTPFFLYIGHNEFEQSNVVPISEGVGGVTEPYKNRFMVPHLGPREWLDDVVHHEFTHVVQFNVLYGGFWKSVRLIKSIIYPNWLLEGMAAYSEKYYDKTERDMYMRDAVCAPPDAKPADREGGTQDYDKLIPVGYLHNFNHVKPHQVVFAYKESATLIEFLMQEYGRDKVKNILELYKDSFDPDSVLGKAAGLTLFDMDRKFREYVKEKYNFSKAGLMEPGAYGTRLTTPGIFYQFSTNPCFLPGGNDIVYITDRAGYNEIAQVNIKTGETRSLVNLKDFSEVENIGRNAPGLSVSADGRQLVFVGEKLQKDYICVYDTAKNKIRKLNLPFEVINSAQISPDGKNIVFTAMKDCYTNLYLLSTEGGDEKLAQLTDGIEDVSAAVFSPDGKSVAFSKEARTDSREKMYQRDLWLLSLSDKSAVKLTDLPNDETAPCFSPNGRELLFCNDQDYIHNLYSFDLGTKETKKLTNTIGGIYNPVFSPGGDKVAFSAFRNGEMHIYLGSRDKLEPREFARMSPPLPLNYLTSTMAAAPKPYKFNLSTDLFFPFFMYSTYDGLMAALYWQLSEMNGNNSLGIYTEYYELSRYLNYQFTYNYSRLRPQFFFQAVGQGGYTDITLTQYAISQYQFLGFSYPFNRFSGMEFGAVNLEDRTETLDNGVKTGQNVIYRNLALVSYSRDTTEGAYLEVTSGSRLRLSYEGGTDIFGADRVYNNVEAETNYFLPLGREQTLAARLGGGSITGRDSSLYTYSLIDYSHVKMRPQPGLDTRDFGTNIAYANLEWRVPITPDLNWYWWFMFPDFLFRSVYGIVFADAGVVWDNGVEPDLKNALYSYGAGVRFHVFILQTYPFSLNFLWGYSPINKEVEYFFSFGPVF
jgi:Tol biopolymer transport system component